MIITAMTYFQKNKNHKQKSITCKRFNYVADYIKFLTMPKVKHSGPKRMRQNIFFSLKTQSVITHYFNSEMYPIKLKPALLIKNLNDCESASSGTQRTQSSN